MKRNLMLVLFAALTFGLLAVPAAQAEDAAYSIVVKRVEVKKTKADGAAWDINDGKPDLKVAVRNLSDDKEKVFETKEKEDTFSAEFNEPATTKVRPGQTLGVYVYDVDVAANDTIGETKVELTADKLKEGKLEVEKFGQVIKLELQLVSLKKGEDK